MITYSTLLLLILLNQSYEFRITTPEYKEKSTLTYSEAVLRLKSLPIKDTVLTKQYFYYEDEYYKIYMMKRNVSKTTNRPYKRANSPNKPLSQ